MGTVLFYNNQKFERCSFDSKSAFKAVIKDNASLLFGDSTVYVDLQTKKESASTIYPDSLLIDLSNSEKPDTYLIEAYLVGLNSYENILSNITKLISSITNPMSRNQLIERILVQIDDKRGVERKIERLLGDRKTLGLHDCLDSKYGILLIIDWPSAELDEIANTYTEWNDIVEIFVLEEYHSVNSKILSLTPKFIADATPETEPSEEEAEVATEDANEQASKAEPLPTKEACPMCGSPMNVLSQSPLITACSNRKCGNSMSSFDY